MEFNRICCIQFVCLYVSKWFIWTQCFKNQIEPVGSIGWSGNQRWIWLGQLSKPLVGQNQNKIRKTRLNHPKSFEPNNRSCICYTVRFRKIHQIDHFVKKKTLKIKSILKLNMHSPITKKNYIFLHPYKLLSLVTSL